MNGDWKHFGLKEAENRHAMPLQRTLGESLSARLGQTRQARTAIEQRRAKLIDSLNAHLLRFAPRSFG
jgi:hypothetical protein